MPSDEELDDEIKKLELELSKSDSPLSSYGSPSPIDKDSQIKLFRDILKGKDSTKVGNLREEELGRSNLGVRHYKEMALFSDTMGLGEVSDYLNKRAEIITSTSMSRKGFFMNLLVTQIKKEQRVKPPEEQKKGLFSFGKKPEQEGEV